MKIVFYTSLAIDLNGALGSGKYDDITIPEVRKRISDQTILSYLKDKLGDELDLSLISQDDQAGLIDQWDRLANAIDERRKLRVQKNGLCLLVAYLLAGIQELTWTN